jgi:hypothetical protein
LANKERIAARDKATRLADPETVRAINRKWSNANKQILCPTRNRGKNNSTMAEWLARSRRA